MTSTVNTLIEMGYTKEKAELAITRSGSKDIENIVEWILAHEDELESTSLTETDLKESSTSNEGATEQPAKSIKCNECGKLFETQDQVEFHAVKFGHKDFEESTEEKKPLTDEEKREQLAKIEAKLKQRRLEREAKEKQEELEREKCRIKSGKEMLEAKKKYEEQEMKKILDQRKREKEEDRLAKQRIREKIEQDKLARKAKFSNQQPEETIIKPVSVPSVNPKPVTNYSEVKLQIRLTDGSSLTQTFQAKEPLSAVRLFIEMKRSDGEGPFSLMTPFPKKVFAHDDYEKPLDSLGLAPSAVIIVKKTA